jgi:hypothetical protein
VKIEIRGRIASTHNILAAAKRTSILDRRDINTHPKKVHRNVVEALSLHAAFFLFFYERFSLKGGIGWIQHQCASSFIPTRDKVEEVLLTDCSYVRNHK